MRCIVGALQVMVARDLIIADAICRHFWWHTLMLFPDELPRGTVVSLSCDDELVPCALVRKQLEEQLRRDADDGSAAVTCTATPAQVQDVVHDSAPAGGVRAGTPQGGVGGAGEGSAGEAEASLPAVRVFVSQGAHGVFVVKPALQRELIAAWQGSIARVEAGA